MAAKPLPKSLHTVSAVVAVAVHEYKRDGADKSLTPSNVRAAVTNALAILGYGGPLLAGDPTVTAACRAFVRAVLS